MMKLTSASEIIRGEVVRRLKLEVIHKPAVSQRAERHKCYTQLLCRVNQATGLVQCLESRVLGLNNVNLSD